MILPDDIKRAVEIIESAGFAAYLVGGCVRDFLMGKNPHDYDITTSAMPEQIIKCFSEYRVIETGLKHGTVTVIIDKEPIEITTYRIDGEYEDNRHPKSVIFTSRLEEDLSRRDFTVNAIAYNPVRGITDLFGGRTDIEKRIIRCVGTADVRFGEDGLRILRALRFSSVLDFSVEKKTADSIHSCRELLKNISKERIFAELSKLIYGINAESVLLEFRDVLEVIIPELNGVVDYESCIGSLAQLKNCPRFPALLASCDDNEVILRRLGADNITVNETKALIFDLKRDIDDSRTGAKLFLTGRSFSHMRRLIELKRAFGENDERCRRIENIIDDVEEKGECVSLKQLAVNGRDILKLGAIGKQVGETLECLLRKVVFGETENEKTKLLREAKQFLDKN